MIKLMSVMSYKNHLLLFFAWIRGQMSQFEPLMGLLSQCLEILSLDLPGFGNSKLQFEEGFKFISEISDSDKSKYLQVFKNELGRLFYRQYC